MTAQVPDLGTRPALDPRPFVKWAGGKTKLLPEILKRLPEKIGTYYEPFVGGGAVFFALSNARRFKFAALGDLNEELMIAYGAIRSDLKGVVRLLSRHAPYSTDEKYFYTVRGQDPRKLVGRSRAARLIYLNRTCFNGLYRVNKKGVFNVPFGRYKSVSYDVENLKAVSAALQACSLLGTYDFEKIVLPAKRGDAVYFDPPYAPLSPTSNFSAYVAGGFGSEDHTRLRDVARKLIDKGVHVLVSNSDTPFVRRIYKGFKIERVEAPRRINAKGDSRGNVNELLISGGRR